jgi:hypothetical protein
MNNFILKIDIKDFFPSFNFARFSVFIKNALHESWTLDEQDMRLLQNCCFDEDFLLPQGFSTSPFIANRMMHSFDILVGKYLVQYQKANAIYTRYSDDIVISCNTKGLTYKILTDMLKMLPSEEYPYLSFNLKKIGIGSVPRGNVLITGLKVNQDNQVDITRKKKDELKLLLSLYSKGRLDRLDYNKLKGNLQFAKYHSPKFFTQLCIRFHTAICELLNKD